MRSSVRYDLLFRPAIPESLFDLRKRFPARQPASPSRYTACMRKETIADWQSLTQLYREMYDGELLNLAAEIDDLTEAAQQVLRDEMKRRGLDRAASPSPGSATAQTSASCCASALNGEAMDSDDPAEEFTWKTLLTECAEKDEVWPLREALRQAGIESWVDCSSSRYAFNSNNPRVLVAADQIEQARAVLAQPIPASILEQFKALSEDYQLPACPQCGDPDPVLESAEPTNCWLCESCGHQWQEPIDPA